MLQSRNIKLALCVDVIYNNLTINTSKATAVSSSAHVQLSLWLVETSILLLSIHPTQYVIFKFVTTQFTVSQKPCGGFKRVDQQCGHST